MSRRGELLLLLVILCACEIASGPPGVSLAEDPCLQMSCEEWQACAWGRCLPVWGRCDHYDDCLPDERCDEDHTCRGPTFPGEDFFADGGGDRVTFEYCGTIQPYDGLEAGKIILGIADFAVRVRGSTEHLSESAYAGRLHLPDGYSLPQLAGKDAVVMGASRIQSDQGSSYRYGYVSFAIAVDALLAAAQGGPVTPAPPEMWLGVRDVLVHVRSFDSSTFKRYCRRAEAVPGQGRLFLDAFGNRDFAEGEDLQIWGNLPLSAEPQVTPENELELCTWYQDERPITRKAFEEGIARTELELSCEVPAEISTPPASAGASFLSFRFRGPINDTAIPFQQWDLGTGQVSTVLDGVPVVADDSYKLAYRYVAGYTDAVVLQSLGDLTTLGPDRYSYNRFYVAISTYRLVLLKEDGAVAMPYSPGSMYAQLERTEVVERGGHRHLKACPLALAADPGIGLAVAACPAGNTDFSPGETLEIAGLLGANQDPAELAAVYGAGCACWLDDEATPDCSQFDAL